MGSAATKPAGTVHTVATLASHWGCGTDTVYALIHSGQLRAFRLGGKLLRIRAEEVERFECQDQATPSSASEAPMPSSGGSRMDDADMRLERLIERRPKPRLVHSGSAEA